MSFYDEERFEERVDALPRHIRDTFRPDGMSAPPEEPPPAPKPKRPYLCLTCGVSLGPITEAEADAERRKGHDIKPDTEPL